MSRSVTCPVGGAGKKAMNASTIVVADAVEGSHVLTIHGYSQQKGLSDGDYFKSGLFNVGDRTWYIAYYPKGYGVPNADWISLHLVLAETTDTLVKIHLRFSLLDHTGSRTSAIARHDRGLGIHKLQFRGI